MGSVDQNNSTVFPLLADGVFEGIYSSTTNFSEILISVETDTTFELLVNFSTNNGVDVGLTKTYTVSIPAGTAFTYSLKPSLRYFQVVLTNTSVSNQTYLRIETILKSVVVYEPDGGTGPSSNVVITGPLNGDGYVEVADMNNSYDGDGNLFVSDTLSQTYLDTINTNVSTIAGNIITRGHTLLWDNSISANGNTSFFDFSTTQVKLLNFYGQTDGDTILTVNFSPDNSTPFKSQYSISVQASQPFGFSIASSPIYVGINSSNAVGLTIYLDYS